MSRDAETALKARILVVGPPGAGAPLVAAEMMRAGRAASSWEGGSAPDPAADAVVLETEQRPVLVALEASDLSCLGRALPPWSQQQFPAQSAAAAHQLDQCRERLFPARLRADVLIDTTHLNEAELLARLRQLEPCLGEQPPSGPLVVVESFAYPRGVPLDLGWCVDGRALRNPFWEPNLRMLSGLDPRVQDFVLGQELAGEILGATERVVGALLPALQERRRRLLRVAVGCTGGFHRSVALTEELGRRLRVAGVSSLIWHRDLDGWS